MPLDGTEDSLDGCRQKYPLPPDVRFVLDGMLNDHQLDEGSYLALNLFVPRKPIMDAIDGEMSEEPATWRRRRSLAMQLMELTDDAMRTFPQEVRNGIAFASLRWLRRAIDDLALVYAQWTLEDETVGGAMKPWLERQRLKRNGEIWKRTARRLLSPAFIARCVKSHEESLIMRAMASTILDRVEGATALTDRFSQYAAEMEAQREAAYIEGIRRLRLAAAVKRHVLKLMHRRRATIKRSLRAVSALVPEDDVRAFVRGGGVTIPGRTLDLVVKLAAPLADCGHGVLDVKAVARDNATPLATLCVYYENMPPLDQLAALALAMSAGEEAEIISDANIVTMFPAGREHALLAEREKRDVAAPSATAAIEPARRPPWARRRVHAREYWEATRDIWIDRLSVFACGRRSKLLAAAS